MKKQIYNIQTQIFGEKESERERNAKNQKDSHECEHTQLFIKVKVRHKAEKRMKT